MNFSIHILNSFGVFKSGSLSFTFEKESLRMAFDSVMGRKLRSGLTILKITIGIAAIISLVSIGEGMRLMITEQLGGFGANKILVAPSAFIGEGMSMGPSY